MPGIGLPYETFLNVVEMGCEDVSDAIKHWKGRDFRIRKPNVQNGRLVCKEWRNVIDRYSKPCFWISHLGLLCSNISRCYYARMLFNFKKHLTISDSKGEDIIVYFHMHKGAENAAEIELRLFIHGMLFIAPFQHRICGIDVRIAQDRVLLRLLKLLSSLQLPFLEALEVRYIFPGTRGFYSVKTSGTVQGSEPLFTQKEPDAFFVDLANSRHLKRLQLPDTSWLGGMTFRPSVISHLTVSTHPEESRGFYSQADFCESLKHLRLKYLRILFHMYPSPPGQISTKAWWNEPGFADGHNSDENRSGPFDELETLILCDEKIPDYSDSYSSTFIPWLISFLTNNNYPRLEQIYIETSKLDDWHSFQGLSVRERFPELHTVHINSRSENLFRSAPEFVIPENLKEARICVNQYMEVQIRRTSSLLLVKARNCPYKSFLDLLEHQWSVCPPKLYIRPMLDLSPAIRRAQPDPRLVTRPLADISIPSLIELSVFGLPTVLLELFLLKLKAVNLIRVSITCIDSESDYPNESHQGHQEIRVDQGPYTCSWHCQKKPVRTRSLRILAQRKKRQPSEIPEMLPYIVIRSSQPEFPDIVRFPSVRFVHLSTYSENQPLYDPYVAQNIFNKLVLFPNIETLEIGIETKDRHELGHLLMLFHPRGKEKLLPYPHLSKLKINMNPDLSTDELDQCKDDLKELVEKRMTTGRAPIRSDFRLDSWHERPF